MDTELLVDAGGVFSKFIVAIENLYHLNVSDNYYLKCIDQRAINSFGENPFDYILEQPSWYGKPVLDPNKFQRIQSQIYPTFDYSGTIEKSPKFSGMSKIAKSMKLNSEMKALMDQHTHLVSESVKTIGVHIRATDMHYGHRRLGTWNVDQYMAMVEYMLASLKQKKIDNVDIFIASDNEEGISKFVERFGKTNNVRFVPNLSNRVGGWNDDSGAFHLSNFTKREYWQDSFLEMYMLSLCNTLVVRTSNLNNFSRLYYNKDEEQEIIWLPFSNDPIWVRTIYPKILPDIPMTEEEKLMQRKIELEAAQMRAERLRKTERRYLYSEKMLGPDSNKNK